MIKTLALISVWTMVFFWMVIEGEALASPSISPPQYVIHEKSTSPVGEKLMENDSLSFKDIGRTVIQDKGKGEKETDEANKEVDQKQVEKKSTYLGPFSHIERNTDAEDSLIKMLQEDMVTNHDMSYFVSDEGVQLKKIKNKKNDKTLVLEEKEEEEEERYEILHFPSRRRGQ